MSHRDSSYYQTLIPSATEAADWGNFDFMDLSGQANQVEVQYTALSGFLPMGGQYGTLRGFQNQMRILANARPHSSLDGVVGSVYQDIEFTRIPIFQFAVFYNVLLEIDPGANHDDHRPGPLQHEHVYQPRPRHFDVQQRRHRQWHHLPDTESAFTQPRQPAAR